MAVITRGIELYYLEGSQTGSPTFGSKVESLGYLLTGLQEVGELSGLGAGVAREQIEVTTLADDKHVYVDGIQADSELAGITFKFLYDAELFKFLKELSEFEQEQIASGAKAGLGSYKVRIPLGGSEYSIFTMKATVTDLKVDSAAVNAALTMSLTLTPYEAITIA